VRGHPPAALDLVTVNSSRVRRSRFDEHRVQSPAEVDRRGAAVTQHALSGEQILALRRRERVAVRGCDADGRRSPDRERPYRLCHVGGGATLQLDLVVGQAALVEEDDAVLLQPHNALRVQRCHRSNDDAAGCGHKACQA
jgi:hypothetical protein